MQTQKIKSRSTKRDSGKKESRFVSHEHLDKIGEVALYYGFTPCESPTVTKADIDAAKDILDGDFVCDSTESELCRFPLHAEEKIALIRQYHERQMHSLPQPVMLYFRDSCKTATKKKGSERYADLEILGTSGSIAEATLIQTARAMLAEENFTDTRVEINSVGDRDSIAKFSRELTNYYRKHINDMSPACRQLLKNDPFELLASDDPSCQELNAGAPRSIDFLSEISRRHLEEVLEYFEALEIPYTLNNRLLGNKKYCTETIFTIISTRETRPNERKVLALGVRYNGLAKRLNMKRDIQGVGISLLIKNGNKALRKDVKKFKKPIASFLQLSQESKLLSLGIIESLRKVGIPLCLSLAKDRLGAQVSSVEKHHTPYVIVIGKKEAVEKNAIVRRTETHAQDIIPIEELPRHMKKIEKDHWK